MIFFVPVIALVVPHNNHLSKYIQYKLPEESISCLYFSENFLYGVLYPNRMQAALKSNLALSTSEMKRKGEIKTKE